MVLDQIINLINALAKLAISVVILIIILIFRKEISDILKRLKRGKVLGQEIELEKQLDRLSENILESKKKMPELAEAPIEKKAPEKAHYDEFSNILKKAEKDPKDALNTLGLLVEVELKNLVAIHGLLQYFERGFSFLQAAALLQNRDTISKSTASSLRQFYNLRNNIIHAHIETTEE